MVASSPSRKVVGAAITALVIALTGCGDSGSPDQEAAKQVVEDFGVALVKRDGETACAQLTQKARVSIRDLINRVIVKAGKPEAQTPDCSSALTALVGSRNIQPGADESIRDAVDAMSVSVKGTAATATLTAGTQTLTVPLVKAGDSWLISNPNELVFGAAPVKGG